MTEAIRTWRLLEGEARPSAWQTACSTALLESRAAGNAPDTFRFMRYQSPCLLVGAHQIAPEPPAGMELQRRITGGPVLAVGPNQIAWELVVSRKTSPDTAATATVDALRKLGYPVDRGPDCLLLNKKPVAWFVETSLKQALLLQGILLVHPAETGSMTISLFEAGGGRAPSIDEIAAALQESFRERFQVVLEKGELTPEERATLAAGTPMYRNESWVANVRFPEGTVTEATTIGKGGAVRAIVRHGKERNQIDEVVFAGEFCVHPRGAVRDLERELANTSIDEAPARIETYFLRTGAEAPGLTPGDFFMALSLAFMKRRITQSSAPDPQAWKKDVT